MSPRYPEHPGYVAGDDTSEGAAASMEEAAPIMRVRAEDMLRARGPLGLTSDELEVLTGWRHQTASARLRELVLAGRAVDSDERRRTTSGRPARVRRHRDFEVPRG